MIAVTHPGKMGDALYTLPVIRALCEKYQTKADFITSTYCEPLRELFEFQSCISNFLVSERYKPVRFDMGVQPYLMPVDGVYENVFHLGFRGVPDTRLDHYMAGIARITPKEISYELPPTESNGDYYVLAPRGETTYKELFLDFVDKSDKQVLVVGGVGDYIGKGVDATGLDFLETAQLISVSKGFVGLMSSMLVLANGFDIPRIAPHDGKSWDMRHVVYSPKNYYPINPKTEDILNILKG